MADEKLKLGLCREQYTKYSKNNENLDKKSSNVALVALTIMGGLNFFGWQESTREILFILFFVLSNFFLLFSLILSIVNSLPSKRGDISVGKINKSSFKGNALSQRLILNYENNIKILKNTNKHKAEKLKIAGSSLIIALILIFMGQILRI